jgi:hypothetical protein
MPGQIKLPKHNPKISQTVGGSDAKALRMNKHVNHKKTHKKGAGK